MIRKIQIRGRGRAANIPPEVLSHIKASGGDMLKFELLEDGSVKVTKAATEEIERG